MDTCNGLRDLSTMVALYRFPRDIESLRATRALLAHDAKEYIDLMGPYMGSVDETGRKRGVGRFQSATDRPLRSHSLLSPTLLTIVV